MDQHLLQTISDIQLIVLEEGCAATLKIEKIAALLERERPQAVALEEQVTRLKMEVETAEQEKDYFRLLSQRSLKLQSLGLGDCARDRR